MAGVERDARLRNGRKSRVRWLDLDGLESRTLLATTPAAAATGGAVALTNSSSVTTTVTSEGNANSPTIVIDPYDPDKLFAVWGVDLSSLSTVPHTTAVVEGAYSDNGGANWTSLGTTVAPVQIDAANANAPYPTNYYTQVTDPSIGFDSQDNVYILTLQTTGATDGELYLTEFNFSNNTPSEKSASSVYQWVPGEAGATDPALAVDAARPPAGTTADPDANNVYVAWASIDEEPSNTTPYAASGFNPNRVELAVGTPITNPSANEESLAFSGVKSVNVSSNFGPQDDSHPQLVINQNDGGQITVAWDDFGTGSTATPLPYDELMSSLVQPGDTYGFTSTNTGPYSVAGAQPAGNWSPAVVYNAGPQGSDADPVSIAVGDVDGQNGNDIVLADEGIGQIGELLNNGTGTFTGTTPATTPVTALTYAAGNGPSSVVLGNIGNSTILNAAVANVPGGVSVLTNDGTGDFGTLNHYVVAGEQETIAVAEGNLDGTGLSLVAVDENSSTITIFPDGTATGAFSFSSVVSNPIAVIVAPFRGPAANPDIAVLNASGKIQFFLNESTGPGNFNFVAGTSINVGSGAVGMTTGSFFTVGGLPDLAVVRNIGNTGLVEVAQNTSTPGGASISFAFSAISDTINSALPLPGVPVGIAAGDLSGISTGLSDIAVAYQNVSNPDAPDNESMVAVFENNGPISGSPNFSRVSPIGSADLDYDAGTTDPTAITVGSVSGGAFEDIIVASNEGRGYVSVLTASTRPAGAVSTDYYVPVSVSNPSALDDLTVTVALTDQESVQNLSLTLVAPNGDRITLVQNQNNTAGTANTAVGLPSGNEIGVDGFTTGATGTPGVIVGTIFDDNATKDIFDATNAAPPTNANASPYIGYFRPEYGSLKSFLASEVAAGDINGTWTLEVTNYTSTVATGVANQGELEELSLQFSSGLSASSPRLIDTTYVTGAIGNTYALKPPSSPNTGVGPGLVLAIDNTLGDTSPNQGRIYAAFVGYEYNMDPNEHVNPTTNTDIELAYSDNGGLSWIFDGIVNNDNADADGYSGSSVGEPPLYAYTSGQTQFQPAIAVDQATGTLVVSWRDARNDAANARVATYLTTSIDGGNTFSPQTYANPAQTAVDAISGQTDVLGPEADNQSTGNAQADTTFGYGDQMGLAVFDGQVYPVWAGNLNQSSDATGTVIASPLNIWYRPMVIAAGPRIITSTMGPIPLAEATGGSVSISVTFDRGVTASTFVAGDVQVFFHDTTNGDPSVPLTVTGVSPVISSGVGPDDEYGFTQFTITFNPTPAGANPATYNYTGTYSYLIAPDAVVNGDDIVISSPIESYIGTTLRTSDPMDQNADGTSDENPLTSSFTGTNPADVDTPGDVYAVPTPEPSVPVIAFTGFLSSGSTLVDEVISTTGTSDDPAAGLAVGQAVSGMGIAPGTTITSVYTEDFGGTLIAFATLSIAATASGSEDLVATSTVTFTTAQSILTPPFNQNTLPIIVPGPQVLGSLPGLAFTGTLTNGSASVKGVLSTGGTAGVPAAGLAVGQVVTGTGIPAGTTIASIATSVVNNTVVASITLSADATASGTEDLVAADSSSLITDGTADTLGVTFDRPMQVGTFTPGQVDQIMGPAGSVSGPQYFPSTSSTGQIIPAASTLDSTVTIPSYNGTFTIADITVELNAAFSPDSDLTGVLIAPDGTQVTLFSGVGGTGSNFINTVFDDSADSSITTGTAPFTGSYRPAQSLSALDGHTVDIQNPAAPSLWVPGVWTLQITNSATGATGMLDNWSLNITPVITVIAGPRDRVHGQRRPAGDPVHGRLPAPAAQRHLHDPDGPDHRRRNSATVSTSPRTRAWRCCGGRIRTTRARRPPSTTPRPTCPRPSRRRPARPARRPRDR